MRPHKLMVVDDSMVFRNRIARLAADPRLPRVQLVAMAENGEEALRILRDEGPFDLVLMDMQMPKMDGLEATRRLRASEQALGLSPVPVIALTANASDADRQACRGAGMDDFLSKPFRAEDFKAALARHL